MEDGHNLADVICGHLQSLPVIGLGSDGDMRLSLSP